MKSPLPLCSNGSPVEIKLPYLYTWIVHKSRRNPRVSMLEWLIFNVQPYTISPTPRTPMSDTLAADEVCWLLKILLKPCNKQVHQNSQHVYSPLRLSKITVIQLSCTKYCGKQHKPHHAMQKGFKIHVCTAYSTNTEVGLPVIKFRI